MAFPMAILCFFIGGLLVWVGAHGTNATSPFELFQQVIDGISGESADAATESASTDDGGPADSDRDTSSSTGRFGQTGG